MPTPVALKTQLEQAFATTIYAFAGVTGSGLDPDLAAGQRIKEATGGYLLLPNDLKQGPLVRLKLMKMVNVGDEIGEGEGGRSAIYNATLRIVGVSAASSSISKTATDRDMLDQVILLDVLKALSNVAAEAKNLTGGKAAYAAELKHLSTEWDESLTEGGTQGSKLWAATFTQDWNFIIEQTAGS